MSKDYSYSDDPNTFSARTGGLLPRDRVERFTSGSSDDHRRIEAVYGNSTAAFAAIILLEERARQEQLPDRFVLKAPTSRKHGRGKK